MSIHIQCFSSKKIHLAEEPAIVASGVQSECPKSE
jgi:hypothetical protein